MGDTVIYGEIVISALAVDEVQQDLVAYELGARCAIVREVIPMLSCIIGRRTVGIVVVRGCRVIVEQRDNATGRYRSGHRDEEYPIVEMHGLV